eukprot:TRINITY_DN61_c0_g1_i2.p1 TRINITY_DN61_c0_g1~~TRINITY_DN61_c0_g1_i2.p1  ORF type:complete len:512 (-),score=109.67 TRINITY_DN61_c0_g1_i2:141-1676(-)
MKVDLLVLLLLVFVAIIVVVRAHEQDGVVPLGKRSDRRTRSFQRRCEAGANACVLQHQASEGPFYLQQDLVRKDIRENQGGIPLTLRLRFRDVNTCKAVAKASIEIWHCNATGVYSGVNTPSNQGGAGTTWLRGTQHTDPDGYVFFETIFPGYELGRPTHLHYKVRLAGSSDVVFTGQTFFSEDLVTQVNNLAPYNTNTHYRVHLADDATYNVQSTSLAQMTVQYRDPSAGVSGGLIGMLDFGVDASYDGPVYPEPLPQHGFSGHPPCISTLTPSVGDQWFDGTRNYAVWNLAVVNNGPAICPVTKLIVYYNNTNVIVQSSWGLIDAQQFTLGTLLSKPAYKLNQYGQALNPGQSISGYGAIVSWNPAETNGNPIWRLGHVTCGGTCANDFSVFVPGGTSSTTGPSVPSTCSTVSFTNSLVNAWNTASETNAGSQWNVVLTNTGSTTITFVTFSTSSFTKISSIWNVNNNGNGVFALPSHVQSLAPGASISFGYVVNQANALVFSVNQITC